MSPLKKKEHEGLFLEMTFAERHRFLRHSVVQDRGASNGVTHENKNVTHQHFYPIFVFNVRTTLTSQF